MKCITFILNVATHARHVRVNGTGGQTSVSVSFGIGSYNMNTGETNGIWNWGENSTRENIGYSLGVLGNVSDAVTFYDKIQSFKNTPSNLSKEELIKLHDKYSNTKLNNKHLRGEGNYAGNSAPGVSPEDFRRAGIELLSNDGVNGIFGGYHHDLGYYNAGTDGIRGVLFNTNVTKVDWSLARGMAQSIKQGGLTVNQLHAANIIRNAFTIVTGYKTLVTNQYILSPLFFK